MYSYSQQVRENLSNHKLQRRVMAILIVVLLAGCVTLGVVAARAGRYRAQTRAQCAQRMVDCVNSAKAVTDKLTGSVSSDTAAKLSQIQQYVYAIDQLNGMVITLGGEGARVVPAQAFDALYEDLSTYFTIIQTNTTSVLETHSLLINHIAALQLAVETGVNAL